MTNQNVLISNVKGVAVAVAAMKNQSVFSSSVANSMIESGGGGGCNFTIPRSIKLLKVETAEVGGGGGAARVNACMAGSDPESLDLQVLSDPQKRAIYDQYGEEGLKGGIPPPDAGGPGGATYFQTGDGPNVFRFNPRNANDIFAEIFGFSSPMGGGMGGGGYGNGMRGGRSSFGGMFRDDMFSSFGEGKMYGLCRGR
ncbi:uncharacterized protein LOC133706962 isoform X2 [Rosa rugosa]|nr:uncharacterized protein LOC133706962 isoform X2 [Rosa rugosa]